MLLVVLISVITQQVNSATTSRRTLVKESYDHKKRDTHQIDNKDSHSEEESNEEFSDETEDHDYHHHSKDDDDDDKEESNDSNSKEKSEESEHKKQVTPTVIHPETVHPSNRSKLKSETPMINNRDNRIKDQDNPNLINYHPPIDVRRRSIRN